MRKKSELKFYPSSNNYMDMDDVLILKIIFKKKYYFNIFLNKKYFKVLKNKYKK
jgi:hypothetical protein